MFIDLVYLGVFIAALGGIVTVLKNQRTPFLYGSAPLALLLAGYLLYKGLGVLGSFLPYLLSPVAGGVAFLMANVKLLAVCTVLALIAVSAFKLAKAQLSAHGFKLKADKD